VHPVFTFNMADTTADLFPDVFIACYLLFALFWDSSSANLIHKAVKSRTAFLVRLAGLDHTWNMYAGPFLTITRLETRLTYDNKDVEVLPPPRRYEFRRYYFMMGVRPSAPLYRRYLSLVEKRVRDNPRGIERIEIVKRVWKSPTRVGGVLGRFEVGPQQKCRETVVAVWTRT